MLMPDAATTATSWLTTPPDLRRQPKPLRRKAIERRHILADQLSPRRQPPPIPVPPPVSRRFCRLIMIRRRRQMVRYGAIVAYFRPSASRHAVFHNTHWADAFRRRRQPSATAEWPISIFSDIDYIRHYTLCHYWILIRRQIRWMSRRRCEAAGQLPPAQRGCLRHMPLRMSRQLAAADIAGYARNTIIINRITINSHHQLKEDNGIEHNEYHHHQISNTDTTQCEYHSFHRIRHQYRNSSHHHCSHWQQYRNIRIVINNTRKCTQQIYTNTITE